MSDEVTKKKKNGAGLAGFILALVGLVFCWLTWVPIFGWIIMAALAAGFILSLMGVFKKPKGLALVGLILSAIGIFVTLWWFGAAIALFFSLT
jgi:hypothetical protein